MTERNDGSEFQTGQFANQVKYDSGLHRVVLPSGVIEIKSGVVPPADFAGKKLSPDEKREHIEAVAPELAKIQRKIGRIVR